MSGFHYNPVSFASIITCLLDVSFFILGIGLTCEDLCYQSVGCHISSNMKSLLLIADLNIA